MLACIIKTNYLLHYKHEKYDSGVRVNIHKSKSVRRMSFQLSRITRYTDATGVGRVFVWGTSGHASRVHTFEAVAGSWGSVSAPAVSRVVGGSPERNKNSKQIYVELH